MRPQRFRPTARDWAVGALVAVAMLVRVSVGGGPADATAPLEGVAVALAVLTGAALVWRRRRPAAVAAVAVAATGLTALLTGPVLPVGGWAAVAVCARQLPTLAGALRGAAAAAAAVVAGSVAGAVVHHRSSALPLLVSLTAVVLLATVAARLQASRIEAQRRHRDAERQRAVTDERLRIARDLHDLVGHGLSTIAVQSGAARLALDAGDAATARHALGAVEAASRGALAEMRQMLGVLRDSGPDAAPAPGLDRVGALADDTRAAGHRVSVTRDGPLDTVPAAVGLTAYRVVQEAVTNAVRHAGGARVTIALRAGPDALAVEVVDDGMGAPAADDRPRYGLAGLRERVTAAGGTLEAGPRVDAPGWRVAARLPLGGERP